LLYSRFCRFLALLWAVLLSSPALGARPVADLATIKALATEAYLWGLGPQYVEQTSTYNTIIGAPFNALKYGSVPAAWNNDAVPAGDASVLYVVGFMNFDEAPELVLTVPPSRVPGNQYYVVAYYDAYANTIGSIGTRTTPSDAMTSYLLVGPKSPYAKKQTAKIRGHEYPVMASDTNVSWFLIRIVTNTLIDASDPKSLPNVDKNVVQKFALNSLQEFQIHGHQPVYPTSFDLPPPTLEQRIQAAPYKNAPKAAIDFFTQLGSLVATSPIPHRNTGLSGTPLKDLPTWVVPQYGAKTTYLVPSFGQKEILDSFAPLGLTEDGFRIPAGWGIPQLAALQAGYEQGQSILRKFIDDATGGGGGGTNSWGIVNDIVGTYPNNLLGYLFRSTIVVEGGVANVPLDGVYPTLTRYQAASGNPTVLNGDNTYTLTFTPPTNPSPPLGSAVEGIYPPIESDIISGEPKGFWSVHVYATSSDSNAPFIAQTSLLNTTYSTVDTQVVSINAAADTMTVSAPNWGKLVESTPILFGGDATAYGLMPNTVYYVASRPIPNAQKTTYTFQISTQWVQDLTKDENPPVPIQDSGNPGNIVDLLSPVGAGPLMYGMVKPVTQLGSSQLAAEQLVKNADKSLTLWFGPTLPPGAPASNWIPTPNNAYYKPIYGENLSTDFQLTLRMYFPTPGDKPPSILPCAPPHCKTVLHESYIPPEIIQLVQ